MVVSLVIPFESEIILLFQESDQEFASTRVSWELSGIFHCNKIALVGVWLHAYRTYISDVYIDKP